MDDRVRQTERIWRTEATPEAGGSYLRELTRAQGHYPIRKSLGLYFELETRIMVLAMISRCTGETRMAECIWDRRRRLDRYARGDIEATLSHYMLGVDPAIAEFGLYQASSGPVTMTVIRRRMEIQDIRFNYNIRLT